MHTYYGSPDKLIEEITVTGAAVQNLDFATVLDGDVGQGWMVEWWIKNGAAATVNYSLRLNGSAAVATRQRVRGISTTIDGAAGSSVLILGLPTNAGNGSTGYARLVLPFTQANALERFADGFHNHSSTGTTFAEWNGVTYHITTPAVATKFIGLGMGSDNAAGIGIGSIGRIWRR